VELGYLKINLSATGHKLKKAHQIKNLSELVKSEISGSSFLMFCIRPIKVRRQIEMFWSRSWYSSILNVSSRNHPTIRPGMKILIIFESGSLTVPICSLNPG
jgi:hypothetical protein